MFRSKTKIQLATVFLTAVLWAVSGCDKPKPFACDDPIGCVHIKPEDPIEIGVMQVLSGGLKPSGLMQVRGVELALAERNNQLLGHPIVLQVKDSECSSEGGENAALWFSTQPKILGIIGPFCSGAAVTSSSIISKAGMTPYRAIYREIELSN